MISRRNWFYLSFSCVSMIPGLACHMSDKRNKKLLFQSTQETVSSGLSFHIKHLPVLYFLLRKEALLEQSTLSSDWIPSLESMKRAIRLVKIPMGFSLIEGFLASYQSIEEMKKIAETLPEKGPAGIPVRHLLLEISDSLQKAEALFLKTHWPSARSLLESTLSKSLNIFSGAGQKKFLSFLLSGLMISDIGFEVPVFLLRDAPNPGGFTVRSRSLTAVSFVSTSLFQENTLLEVILHEAIHALETAAGAQDHSILFRIRNGLLEKGISQKDPLYRTIPHTLMFIHSGETIRRLIEADYKHYGDTHGYYEKEPQVTKAMRTLWESFLDDKISLDETIVKIVSIPTFLS